MKLGLYCSQCIVNYLEFASDIQISNEIISGNVGKIFKKCSQFTYCLEFLLMADLIRYFKMLNGYVEFDAAKLFILAGPSVTSCIQASQTTMYI
jgi:hypothetical protein